MRTTATNKKIRELVGAIADGKLVPRPEFQRRLVWTTEDKNRFLDTVLSGFPFPEIYVADGDVDLRTGDGTQLLVDGQQRITTLYQYFRADPELKLNLSPYAQLSQDQQRTFLNYDVAVRDLGAVTPDQVLEVFRRINATNYALNEMEINNAVYAGKLKKFADKITGLEFFERNSVFRPFDLKRMGDLRFALSIVITMMTGYFNRDDELEPALKRFNDEFPNEELHEARIRRVFDFIDECGFSKKSRIWKRADLFTAVIELDLVFNEGGPALQPGDALNLLEEFYSRVDSDGEQEREGVSFTYYKAALQASNDRLNRLRRGVIIGSILRKIDPERELRDMML
jgi:hypothetical protein